MDGYEQVSAYEVEEGDTISDGRVSVVIERVRPHHRLPGHRWWTADGEDVIVRDYQTFWRAQDAG